jgi:hypothetical protein
MMLVCLAFCFLPLNKDRGSEIDLKNLMVFTLLTEELIISIGSRMMDHLMYKSNNTENSRVTPSVSGCLGKECPST